MSTFTRLLIAHLVSDIPLNRFASEKRRRSRLYRSGVLSLHTAIVFLTTLLCFVDRLSRAVVFLAFIVAVALFLIDALRLWVEKWALPMAESRPTYSKRKDLLRLLRFCRRPGSVWSEPGFQAWFLLNGLDQCLHLAVLILVAVRLGRLAP